ncbi:hypothetical protein CI610_03057 [invertebrate metagenome]|uniref:Uncharacterized protein n=1 Tax=invertebrate metagenome TaxID=1711999 RepID=A0A2H9T480_9ZZZZ
MLLDALGENCSFFYKIKHKLSPNYLTSLLPPLVSENSQYNLRNANNYSLPNYRLHLTNSSFFPSTIQLWNHLDNEIRQSVTYSAFKHSLQNFTDTKVPFYYQIGDRKHNIMHARLRNRSSTLNNDLFHANLINFKHCQCGHPVEDAYHFFFECNNYSVQRLQLFRDLNYFIPLDLQLLLFGKNELSHQENVTICQSTKLFIKNTNRF